MVVAKALALGAFLVILELIAVPAFAFMLLDPDLTGAALGQTVVVLLLADVAIAVVGTLVGALAIQTRARDLIVPLIALPLLLPVVIGAAKALRPRSRWPAPRRCPAAGWRSSGSMIWSSGSSPTPSSTTCWRTEPSPCTARSCTAFSLSVATVVTLIGGYALAASTRPMDADQGFMQKIFYMHVPMAIVALCGFVFGGICAIMHLRTNESKWDLRSYVAIHLR